MEDFRIGSLINKRLIALGKSKTWLGSKLGIKSSASSGLDMRKDFYCTDLLKISIALKHDFFSYYYKQLPAEISESIFAPQQTANENNVKDLEKQLADLKKENEYLKTIAELAKKIK